MAKASNLCRGEHCASRAQCIHYLRYITCTEAAPSIAHCTDGKLFNKVNIAVNKLRRRL